MTWWTPWRPPWTPAPVTQAVARPRLRASAAKDLLAASGAGTRATWDERFGTLRSVRGAGYLSAPASGSSVDVARGWLRSHAAAFGLSTAQVDTLAVTRDHALPGTGHAHA